MTNAHRKTIVLKLTLLLIALSASTVDASVIQVGPSAFVESSTLITFTGVLDGTEVNGLSVGGVLFSYSLGNGSVIIDGGPGVTNNVNPPNVVSIVDTSGVLTLTLPDLFDSFGYGYAILNTFPVSNATTITLFSGATNVGSLSYDAVSDPFFAGGFAGIQSTIPFNNVAIAFNSTVVPAFALDNIRFTSASAVPEPSTMFLMLSGAAVLLLQTRRRSS
jgi:hypothetical protein